MTSIEDDPQLTAYLLGELSPADAADVEARLLSSEEGQTLLEELRATAAVLDESLAAELERLPGIGAQRVADLASAETPCRRPLGWWASGILAAAACLALGVLGIVMASRMGKQHTPTSFALAPAGGTALTQDRATRPAAPESGPAGTGGESLVLFPLSIDSSAPESPQTGSALALLGIDAEQRTFLLDEPPAQREFEIGAPVLSRPTATNLDLSPPAAEHRPLAKTPFSFDPS
jgi:hypothetical protein